MGLGLEKRVEAQLLNPDPPSCPCLPQPWDLESSRLPPRSAKSQPQLPRRHWAGGLSLLLVPQLLKLNRSLVCGPRQGTCKSCHVVGMVMGFPLLQKR